jgi:hypothetical protein
LGIRHPRLALDLDLALATKAECEEAQALRDVGDGEGGWLMTLFLLLQAIK